jgi:hypothetical protein
MHTQECVLRAELAGAVLDGKQATGMVRTLERSALSIGVGIMKLRVVTYD